MLECVLWQVKGCPKLCTARVQEVCSSCWTVVDKRVRRCVIIEARTPTRARTPS